jgi:hypothetical protein
MRAKEHPRVERYRRTGDPSFLTDEDLIHMGDDELKALGLGYQARAHLYLEHRGKRMELPGALFVGAITLGIVAMIILALIHRIF